MSSTTTSPERIAVIGLGNPIMGDDGFGLAVLARLRDEWSFGPHVELVDGGTWGLSLLPVLEAADHVLLLDAIRIGVKPGAVVLLRNEEVPRRLSTKLSPHQIDVREILAIAELRGSLPRELIALGAEPGAVDLRDGLSPELETAVDVVVALAVDRLQIWGAYCEHVGPAVV
jgi:hydrogenase maturation protease